MSELEQLLTKATLEPGYGPAFYRALLSNDVFALIPKRQMPPSGNRPLRHVAGEDDVRVVPFFTSRATARRALTNRTRALRVGGRAFLKACLGTTVVLNPNESYTFRLAPHEVERLVHHGHS